MTQASLRTVTLKTFANYRHSAERAVGAYRAGGRRLIAAVQQGVDQAAKRGAEPYVPGLAAALRRVGDNMGTLAVKSLEAVTASTERAIELGSAGVTAQFKRAADFAGRVDNSVVAKGLQAAVRVSLPGAQVALALSERVAAGADKLADLAAGPRSRAVKAVAQRSRRAAPKAAKPVARRAKSVESQAATPVVKATRKPPARKPAAKPVAAKPVAAKPVAAKPVRRAAAKAKPVAVEAVAAA